MLTVRRANNTHNESTKIEAVRRGEEEEEEVEDEAGVGSLILDISSEKKNEK